MIWRFIILKKSNLVFQLSSSKRTHILLLNFELFRVLEIFEKYQIPVIAYKGPILAKVAYEDPSLRPFDDLDLLIPDSHYFAPKQFLPGYGYVLPPYETLNNRNIDRLHYYLCEYAIVHERTGTCIDVHRTSLGNGSLTLIHDLPQLWNRIITITIAGKEIPTFSHSDLLIYLCLNGFKDGWESLRSVCDVSGVLQRQAEHLEWDYILPESRKLKIDRIVGFGLLLAHQLLEAPLPDDILAYIKYDHGTVWLVDRICSKFQHELETRQSRHPIEALILKWVGLKYGSARRKYVFGALERVIKFSLAINYRDTDFIQLPKQLYFLYYFIRPFRILRDSRQNIFKSLVK